jgi:hypothetical protein
MQYEIQTKNLKIVCARGTVFFMNFDDFFKVKGKIICGSVECGRHRSIASPDGWRDTKDREGGQTGNR